MKAKLLKALKPGDVIDIVSPGSASRMEDVERAIELLESWELKPRFFAESFGDNPFHSNEDKQRLEAFVRAISARDSKAVWCLRGGYGANRLLPFLWKMKAPQTKKILVGYSDISSLHFLLQRWGWVSFHGPLLETLTSGRLDIDQIEESRQLVFGRLKNLTYDLVPLNAKAKAIKNVSARVLASNFVVLQSALGTPYAPNLKGKFLILEEVGERGYRVDRMFEHLVQSQILKGCLGIIFGDFIGGNEPDGKNYVQYALDRFADGNYIACFDNMPSGHGGRNRMIPCGSPAIMTGTRKASRLKIDSGIQG